MQAYFEVYREFERKISFINNRNDSCAPHFHSNIELLYVVSGCVDATVRSETRRLSSGDIAIAASYEPHGFTTVESSNVNVFLFPSETVPDFASRTQDSMLASSFLEKCARTKELLHSMEQLRPYIDKEVSVTAKGYMYAILGILSEELGFCRKTDTSQSELLIQKLLFYIEEHFCEPIALADLAREFGYHKDYLSKIFNARIGCGFKGYVNVLRARHAHHLIAKGMESLDEVCFSAGFQCMKSFRRAFLDYYGKTPYEYRRELAKS